MQQLGHEFNKTLNKMHSGAVLQQGMKHALHKAGQVPGIIPEVETASLKMQHGSPSSSFPVNPPAVLKLCFMPFNAYRHALNCSHC